MEAHRIFPGQDDARCRENVWHPWIRPKFVLPSDPLVFAIGSCFARVVETELCRLGIAVRSASFTVPTAEWRHAPSGILNEYSVASIAQRLRWTLDGSDPPVATLCRTAQGYVDLLLPSRVPVSLERAAARRQEISALYAGLVDMDLLVITLGLIEVWLDRQTGVTLNTRPPAAILRRSGDRFVCRAMNVDECTSMLSEVIRALTVRAPQLRIILTVSPVPLLVTHSQRDAIVANSYSKAVLRVCAEAISQQFDSVDYFPSFEMIMMPGAGSFSPDRVHVRDEVGRDVAKSMVDAYFVNQ